MTTVENLGITQKGVEFYTFDVENFLALLTLCLTSLTFIMQNPPLQVHCTAKEDY